MAIAGLSMAVWVQTSRLSAAQTRYNSFVENVRVKGEQAEKDKVSRETKDRLNKEKVDADYLKDIAARDATISRLRAQRSGSSFVPPASPTARSPEKACFGRAELERAIFELDAEVYGIVKEGDDSRIGLDTAKKWASHLR